jgi:hypothetical protein
LSPWAKDIDLQAIVEHVSCCCHCKDQQEEDEEADFPVVGCDTLS